MTHARNELALQLAGASKLLVAFFEFSVKLCQLGGSFLNPKLQDVIEMPHLFLGVPAHTFVFHVLQSKRKIVSDLFEQSHNVILKHVGIGRVNAEHACELAELLKSKKTGGANSLPQSHVDRKSTRLNSSHLGISYAVFCLNTK